MTCARTPFDIVFVPGMKPKPRPDLHAAQLWRCLVAGVERAQPGLAVHFQDPGCFHLASWTYDFYGEYRDIGLDLPGIEAVLADFEPTKEQRSEIDSLSRRLTRWTHLSGDALPWLVRLIAKDDLRLTMSEARRYLTNAGGAGTRARRAVKQQLLPLLDKSGPVVIMGHSLGSVIAYDVLWELSHEDGREDRVDLLLTLGSPLATRFIFRHLKGSDEVGRRRFPQNVQRWENFSSRGELTALRPYLGRHFSAMVGETRLEALEDHVGFYVAFKSDFGLNVHKSYGYLAHPVLGGVLARWAENSCSARQAS